MQAAILKEFRLATGQAKRDLALAIQSAVEAECAQAFWHDPSRYPAVQVRAERIFSAIRAHGVKI